MNRMDDKLLKAVLCLDWVATLDGMSFVIVLDNLDRKGFSSVDCFPSSNGVWESVMSLSLIALVMWRVLWWIMVPSCQLVVLVATLMIQILDLTVIISNRYALLASALAYRTFFLLKHQRFQEFSAFLS